MLDVDDVGAVGAPEGFGVELVEELFEGADVGCAFDGGGGDADGAVVDGGEADVLLVDEEETAAGAEDDLAGGGGARWRWGFGGLGGYEFEEGVELVEGVGVGGGGGEAGAGLGDGLGDAVAVEGLEEVVDGVDLKGADGVVVVGGGEDDLG